MNHLAHCLLGAARDDLIAGGFSGDHFRGRIDRVPAPLRDGVHLHRRIDALSARVAAFDAAARLLGPDHRRVAPLIIDVVTDHHLARQFHAYHDEPLERFETRVHAALIAHESWLPAPARRQAEGFRRHRMLSSYERATTVRDVLAGIAERARPRAARALRAAIEVTLTRLDQLEAPCLAGLGTLRQMLALDAGGLDAVSAGQ